MKHQSDKIIVLKVSKYSDSHLMVNGINQKGAKISAMAPAALKSKKRFGGGVLEPTHFIEIQYQLAKQEGMLPILKEAQIIESFEGLRSDYDKLSLSFYFLKLIELVAHEDAQDSQSLFSLLGHALKALENAKDFSSLKKHFEIKFLYTQGLLELGGNLGEILKKKFSDYVSFHPEYENSPDYRRLKSSLEDYLGRVDLTPN